MFTTLHCLLYPPLKGFSQIKIDLPKPPRGAYTRERLKSGLCYKCLHKMGKMRVILNLLIIGQTDSEFSKNDPKCAEAEGSYELNKFLLAE